MALTNSRYCSPRQAARQANLGSGGTLCLAPIFSRSVAWRRWVSSRLRPDRLGLTVCGGASMVAADFSGPRPWKKSYQSSGDHRPCYPVRVYAPSGERSGQRHRDSHREIHHRQLSLRRSQHRALTAGRFVKTTADGDQLFGSYVGTATLVQPPAPIGIFQVSGTVTFHNGTGRFDGTTGTSDMVGTPAGRLLPDSGSNSDDADHDGHDLL